MTATMIHIRVAITDFRRVQEENKSFLFLALREKFANKIFHSMKIKLTRKSTVVKR